MPAVDLGELIAALPERVFYLTTTGRDMWCRRPYGFFFSSAEAAAEFAAAEVSDKSGLELIPIGVLARDLVSEDGIAAMRKLDVNRVFIDPRRDPVSGDVFGTILRITPQQ